MPCVEVHMQEESQLDWGCADSVARSGASPEGCDIIGEKCSKTRLNKGDERLHCLVCSRIPREKTVPRDTRTT